MTQNAQRTITDAQSKRSLFLNHPSNHDMKHLSVILEHLGCTQELEVHICVKDPTFNALTTPAMPNRTRNFGLQW